MRPNIFKIRKFNGTDSHATELGTPTNDIKQESLQKSVEDCQKNMNSLMSMFQTFMKQSLKTSDSKDSGIYAAETFNKSELQYEVRDRHIILKVPTLDEDPSKSTIQKWTTQICNAAFSSAFNYYLTEQMTFEQTKVFCSQTIMGNLLRFTEKYNLKEEQLQVINAHLSGSSLEYLQLKYPLTLDNDINKALDKSVEPMNNFQDITNDFLYIHGIVFKYRESGNYNDMIMKVLNTAMETVDETSKMAEIMLGMSNYQDFEIYISQLFQKIYDEEWVNGYKASNKLKGRGEEEHKEKYSDKVKEYTKYLIGRKISENTAQFTEQEINGQNLMIKSPAVLRILTKWCEQLWSKFAKESYYTERAEPVILQDPEFINPFFKWMKNSVDKRLQLQKQKIEEFKKELDSHCNLQQAAIMLKYLEEDQLNFISKYEKANGKFSAHMVKNLHTYIVLYLNRLIHGLLTVSKEFYDKEIDKSWDDWQSPPNFLTFKIGDLVRCKCSSKEKEIMNIFGELKAISNSHPERMKIIRIKNRLREGTNDILLNVRFNDKIICEIQLEVINKSKTKFIQCSNAFSHFIYELKRSIFGPISELCNIWNNFDVRSKTFNKLIAKEKELNLTQTMTVPSCTSPEGHLFQKYILPFECSLCSKSYFHSNYIFSNKNCSACSFKYCVNCQIREMGSDELKNEIFQQKKDQSLKESCTKLASEIIPSQGVCIKIESKEIKIQIFMYVKVESKNWLLGINPDKSLYEIERVQSAKGISHFLKNYCIFELKKGSNFINISPKDASIFSVQEYLRQCYRQHRESLILTQIRFTVQEMEALLTRDGGSDKDRRSIKKIEFASNYLNDMSYFSCFQNLTDINLDFNHFENIDGLKTLKKLEKVEIRENAKLVEIGDAIGELEKLEDFKCSKCAISKISDRLGKLKNLATFKADKNKITALPDSLCDITNLKVLTVSSNKLETIPDRIGNLVNLRVFKVGLNALKEVPPSISSLANLTILSLSSNKLTSCPDLRNLINLQKVQLNQNQISQIEGNYLENQSLKVVNLAANILTKFNLDMTKCKHLESLFLEKNKLTQISDTLAHCSNLATLNLFNNELNQIPPFLVQLKKLSPSLNFSKNRIKEVPPFLKQIKNISTLNLEKNQISEVPLWLQELKELKEVNFAQNLLQSIPDEFQALKDLTQFSFEFNQIKIIPDFIAEFKYIQKASSNIDKVFNHNKISSLSPAIVKAMKQSIKLTYNELEEIPVKHVEDKAELTSIYLISNNIKVIPQEIQELPNLTTLSLGQNKIEVVPLLVASLSKLGSYGLLLDNNPIKDIECKDFVNTRGSYPTRTIVNNLIKDNIKLPVKMDSSDDDNDD